ncbi:MAG: dihydroorotate dehydrogenase-like protein [Nibricoccus sp.]
MNLTTKYLGLELKSPLMPGASPLIDNLDNVKRLEDAGAAAIVMHSLFAEQIEGNQVAFNQHIDRWQDNFAEATSFFPSTDGFAFGPQEYLGQIAKIKAKTSLPVIASLNGTNLGTWIDYAKQIEQAGADALELNTYFLGTSRRVDALSLEHRVLDIVRYVRKAVQIPVSVKLSPFYTSVAHLVGRLEDEKVDGVVLFNRFFQPEINTEELDVTPKLDLSSSEDLRLRLRWLGLLRDQVSLSLACSGGVHTPVDIVKALLAGADAVQVVAELLTKGPGRLAELLTGLQDWMKEHEYESVSQMIGALSLRSCPDAEAYERGNYLRTLQLWKV